MAYWRVRGGEEKGGLIVRDSIETSSQQLPERLATGSVVKQLSLEGVRLQYELVQGSGPVAGWVSIKLAGKDLLVDAVSGKPVDSKKPLDFLGKPLLFGPVQCDAAIIFLHGHDEPPERGWPDKFQLLRKNHPTWRWIHLRAPRLAQTCLGGVVTEAWGDYLECLCTEVGCLDYNNPDTQGFYQASVEAVHACVETLQFESGLDPEHIVIFGFSQGASVALDALLTYPGTYQSLRPERRERCLAGGISLSGWLAPRGRAAVANRDQNQEDTVPLPPVLLIHGDADPWVGFKCSQDAKLRLRKAGVSVQFEPLRGMEHGHTVPIKFYEHILDQFLTRVLEKVKEIEPEKLE